MSTSGRSLHEPPPPFFRPTTRVQSPRYNRGDKQPSTDKIMKTRCSNVVRFFSVLTRLGEGSVMKTNQIRVASVFNALLSPILSLAVLLSLLAPTTARAVPNVVAWGSNYGGQTQVPVDLTNAVAVAGGQGFSLGLKSDGTVVAWGNYWNGHNFMPMTPPADLADVVAVATGDGFCLALRSNGTVVAWSWGKLWLGQTNVPAGLNNVVAIAVGYSHSLALKSDGRVVAWGSNSTGAATVPDGLANVVAIAAGSWHSLALKGDGTVVSWGTDGSGITPLTVPSGLNNVVAIGGGISHSLALKSDGTVVAWGQNFSGQLNVPAGLSNVVAITTRHTHNLALKGDGTVIGWGANWDGEANVPSGLTNVVEIAACSEYSLAVVIGDGSGGSPFAITPLLDQTIVASETANWRVTAAGAQRINYMWRYQWQFYSTNLPGATNATLTLSNVNPGQVGPYSVMVTNAFGIDTSSIARLHVIPALITVLPQGHEVLAGTTVTLTVTAQANAPLTYQWRLYGTNLPGATSTTLTLTNVNLDQAGPYSAVVNNVWGTFTSSAVRLDVRLPVTRYVWQDSPSPAAPYTNWTTAAHVIQSAAAAARPGDTVMVTNGVYLTGTAQAAGPNRVALTEQVMLRSANGPAATIIDGGGSVRCVYLAADAVISGFTLTNGMADSGGGAMCAGVTAVVTNCLITGNKGGGVSGGDLYNCTASGNSGGGVHGSTLRNCVLTSNLDVGAQGSTLYNCTLTTNSGPGASECSLYNCIVYHNRTPNGANYSGSTFEYSCTSPLPPGPGNIAAEPKLVSASHLSPASPCLGAGSATNASGLDIDGEAWANPPCMGADQLIPGSATGPLTMRIEAPHTRIAVGYAVPFVAQNTGRILASMWDFGDGTLITNQAFVSHAWTAPGVYTVRLTGFNDTFPAGVTSTVQVEVFDAVNYVNAANPTPGFPYAS